MSGIELNATLVESQTLSGAALDGIPIPGPQGPSGLFECTWGETTYAQVLEALDDDRLPVIMYNDRLYQYAYTGETGLFFVCYSGQVAYRVRVATNSSTWSTQTSYTNVTTSVDQTISGTKTFSASPIVPTPTESTAAANKGYVDEKCVPAYTAADEGKVLRIVDGAPCWCDN